MSSRKTVSTPPTDFEQRKSRSPGLLVSYTSDSDNISKTLIKLTKKETAHLIGRNTSANIQIADPTVSRAHCIVDKKDGHWFISDLDSHNGLFVNGKRVKDRLKLGNQSVIRIGNALLIFCDDIDDNMNCSKPTDQHGIAGMFSSWKIADTINSAFFSGDHILISGESGTGKELAARLIQEKTEENSRRRPFVEFDGATFGSEDEAVTALFGVAKGTFTGIQQRDGLLKLANGGVLFIDEAHHCPPRVQASLLRGIETGAFRRPGDPYSKEVDVNIVMATNNTDRLLPDLVERLFRVRIPPINERRADIPAIFRHMLFRASREIGVRVETALAALNANHYEMACLHDYTGSNVRKLRRVANRIASDIKRGLPPKAAVSSAFSDEFRWSRLESSHGPGQTSEKDNPSKLNRDHKFYTVNSSRKSSKYERHRQLITKLYMENRGNLSDTARALAKMDVNVSQRWLSSYLTKWGVRGESGSIA